MFFSGWNGKNVLHVSQSSLRYFENFSLHYRLCDSHALGKKVFENKLHICYTAIYWHAKTNLTYRAYKFYRVFSVKTLSCVTENVLPFHWNCLVISVKTRCKITENPLTFQSLRRAFLRFQWNDNSISVLSDNQKNSEFLLQFFSIPALKKNSYNYFE